MIQQAPLTLLAIVISISIAVYLVTSFALVHVLRDRYRFIPAARFTSAGAAIFVAGIGLLVIGGERFWEIPFNVALASDAVGAAIVNVGATMMVGPWLASLVATDLRRVPIAKGTRGTEAHLAMSLVRIAGRYGGTVDYDRDGTFDFDVALGRRDLRVELGALTSNADPDDVTTDPDAWLQRMSRVIANDPPTGLKPILVVVNQAMFEWMEQHEVGFGDYDDDPYFAFCIWNGRADDDQVLDDTMEALLFGITNAKRRAAIAPPLRGLGAHVDTQGAHRVAD